MTFWGQPVDCVTILACSANTCDAEPQTNSHFFIRDRSVVFAGVGFGVMIRARLRANPADPTSRTFSK